MREPLLKPFIDMRNERLKAIRFFTRPNLAKLDFVVISMGFVSTVTFLTGLVYVLPIHAFSLSRSYNYLRDHGGEEFWGVLTLSLGLLALVCTYLEYYRIRFCLLTGEELPAHYVADRLMGRWVWFAVACLWGFVGGSYLVNVPFSPGAAFSIPLGIFSFFISTKARDRREDGI